MVTDEKYFKGKKVLVTGAAGFVGTNLLKRLMDTPAQIRATVHKRSLKVGSKGIEKVSCDLTNAEDCQRVVKDVDIIFHCAASTSGAAVITQNPLVHVTPNIVMNAQLLEAAYWERVEKFLWLGSSTGYPPPGEVRVKEDQLMDGDPYEKYFGVGWMKRYTEVLCRMYSQHLKDPMTTIVLRPTNIYGPFDDFDFKTSHMCAALIRRVIERHDPIEVWGTGDDIRDLIFIEDMVEAIMLAVKNVDCHSAFNVGSGEGISIKDLLKVVCAAENYSVSNVKFDTTKPTVIPIRLVDVSLIEQQLGFSPKTKLVDGIRKTIQWYKHEEAK